VLEFIFLGTSSGIPTLQRNVSGLIVKYRNSKNWCLVDCGEGTQHQILRTPVSLVHLSAIFITHVHGDHCYGLPGLLATASMAGRTEPLTIVAPKGIEEFIHATMQYTDVRMTYDLHFVRTESLSSYTVAEYFDVSCVPLSHRVPSYAYVFNTLPKRGALDVGKLEQLNVPKGPLWGQLAAGATITLASGATLSSDQVLLSPKRPLKAIVGGDNDTPALLGDVSDGADLLIHESTYTQAISDHVGPGPQHSSAKSVAIFAQSVGIPNVILTHFSARYHHPDPEARRGIIEVETEAREFYSGRLALAEDLACFTLDDEGELHGPSFV